MTSLFNLKGSSVRLTVSGRLLLTNRALAYQILEKIHDRKTDEECDTEGYSEIKINSSSAKIKVASQQIEQDLAY
jgi:hypothetical protein